MRDVTTVTVDRKTLTALHKLRKYSRETLDEVIQRLLKRCKA